MPASGIANKEWLEETLLAYSANDFGQHSACLVGWLIAGEDYCFRWRSDYPEVFYGDPMIDGSGADACKSAFDDDDKNFCYSFDKLSIDEPDKVDLNAALTRSLGIATHMMSAEILGTNFYRSLGVGYAYEILYLGDDGFQYLENILYMVLTLQFDEQDNYVDTKIELPFCKYNSYKEYAVVQMIGSEATSATSGKMPIAARAMSPPDFYSSSTEDQIAAKIFSDAKINEQYRSDYCCYFINMVPNKGNPLQALIVPGILPQGSTYENTVVVMELIGTEIQFAINNDLLNHMFSTSYRLQEDYNKKHL